jgi:superfamily II DNA or RNA helicase
MSRLRNKEFVDFFELKKIPKDVNVREFIQEEAASKWRDKGLLKAAPRFGKILTTFKIINKLSKVNKILVCYPRVDIEEGWKNDKEKWGFDKELVFTTYRSIKKLIPTDYDFVVFDEIHECSIAELKEVNKFKNIPCLALSGTVTGKTQKKIDYHTSITPFYQYPISKAVEEGILTDYNILIHMLKPSRTERAKMDKYIYVIEKLEEEGKPTFFLELKMIQVLQKSETILEETKRLIEEFGEERVLVFCGQTEMADQLGIPTYHSKNNEKQLLKDFCEGRGDKLATIKMVQAGITINPINKGVVAYTSGNPEDFAQKVSRLLGFEYQNIDKKAEIHILALDNSFSRNRLYTALLFFDEKKIKYL